MSDRPTDRPRRKRGAQPGNTNARKHGFYSRRFPNLDPNDPSSLAVTIQDEINLVRVSLRRLAAYGNQVMADRESPPRLSEAVALFNAISAGSVRLAYLLKTQGSLADERGSGVAQVVNQALAQVMKDLQV